MKCLEQQKRKRQETKGWNIRINVTKDEEKVIRQKILDSEMNIGEYIKSKLLD